MENYSSKIVETTHELTVKEQIKMKDLSNAVNIDDMIDDAAANNDQFIITPVDYVILEVHNEKAKDRKDYTKYLILDNEGNKFVTGSPSFWNSFKSIWDEMKKAGEDFQIEVYKRPSKNYSGKSFISCSII